MDDLRLGKPEIKIRISEEGQVIGPRAQDIAEQLRAAFYGSTVDETQIDTQVYEIDARLGSIDRDDVAALGSFVIVTSSGAGPHPIGDKPDIRSDCLDAAGVVRRSDLLRDPRRSGPHDPCSRAPRARR